MKLHEVWLAEFFYKSLGGFHQQAYAIIAMHLFHILVRNQVVSGERLLAFLVQFWFLRMDGIDNTQLFNVVDAVCYGIGVSCRFEPQSL